MLPSLLYLWLSKQNLYQHWNADNFPAHGPVKTYFSYWKQLQLKLKCLQPFISYLSTVGVNRAWELQHNILLLQESLNFSYSSCALYVEERAYMQVEAYRTKVNIRHVSWKAWRFWAYIFRREALSMVRETISCLKIWLNRIPQGRVLSPILQPL